MKITLIHLPLRLDVAPSSFPAGLGYIASSLIKSGHEVEVIDLDTNRITLAELEQKIKGSDSRIFGIGCLITGYSYAKKIVAVIKKVSGDHLVVIGGGLGTDVPELVLSKLNADIAVIGEGEQTMPELLDTVSKNGDLEKIEGIAFKKNGKIVKTKLRKRIDNLDELSFPSWDLFPVEVYLQNIMRADLFSIIGEVTGKSMNVVSARGCPYQCTFCRDPLGHMRRERSVRNVVEEIKILKQKYGVENVLFNDPLFVVNKKWVYEFCDAITNEKLNIRWVVTGRTNLCDEELLQKMKSAGCVAINYGIESGSQKMLNIMKKNTTVEAASRTIQSTRKVGLVDWTSFMIGFPEETEETIEETVNFCINNNIHLISIFFVVPYPGTTLFEQVKKAGLIKDEADFVSKLGDATELVINLTKFSDKQLLGLRDNAILKIRKAYFKKHKGEYFKWCCQKIGWYTDFIKTKGLRAFLQAAKNKLFHH